MDARSGGVRDVRRLRRFREFIRSEDPMRYRSIIAGWQKRLWKRRCPRRDDRRRALLEAIESRELLTIYDEFCPEQPDETWWELCSDQEPTTGGTDPGTGTGGTGTDPGTGTGGTGADPGTGTGGTGADPGTGTGGTGADPGTGEH